jgi:hypothetical protein
MKPSELPECIRKHKWVGKHQELMVPDAHHIRLLLEKENVRDIAKWKEMHYVSSQVR